MIVFFLISIFLIYFLSLLNPRYKLNSYVTKIIRFLLVLLFPALICFLILSHFNIYPRGYWTTKVLFCTVFLQVMVLHGIGSKVIFNKFEKAVYRICFYLPLCLLLLLFIPFIGIGVLGLLYTSLIGDQSFIIYSDNNIRIEKQYLGFLGPAPPLEIYRKGYLFSHRDTVLPVNFNEQTSVLNVAKENDSLYSIIYRNSDIWPDSSGEQKFKFLVRKDK